MWAAYRTLRRGWRGYHDNRQGNEQTLCVACHLYVFRAAPGKKAALERASRRSKDRYSHRAPDLSPRMRNRKSPLRGIGGIRSGLSDGGYGTTHSP